MRSPIQFSAVKNYFFGLATSGAILCSGFLYFNTEEKQEQPPEDLHNIEYVESEKIPLEEFNPNALSAEEWQKLGFSERQVATILKYKNMVGGNFSSKEQLERCYAISAEKFSELEPYIVLPEEDGGRYSTSFANYQPYSNTSQGATKKLHIQGKFNPDDYTQQDFMRLGFTPRQSASILKYKKFLGGSFLSKEKFSECYMISEDQYRQMEPYLLLPEKSADNTPRFTTSTKQQPKLKHQPFNPNALDAAGWRALGFSEKQAQVIVNYRERQLKGSFKSLEDIKRCFVISPEKFEELQPFIILNTEVTAPNSVSANKTAVSQTTPQTATDFSTVDLNQITYKQLIEFGFDQKSAAMLLGFRKKLGGFMNRQQIVDTYDINKDLAQKLVEIARLDNSKIEKYHLTDAPEEWLKNHPYFKYSADKIIFYRTTNPNDKKIWKLLKLKPEYETRMKWYIKES